jgi:hypothetical protein
MHINCMSFLLFSSFSPLQILKCPDRKHMGVVNVDPNSTNIGLVNLKLDGCAVMLWPRLAPVAYNGMDSSYW